MGKFPIIKAHLLSVAVVKHDLDGNGRIGRPLHANSGYTIDAKRKPLFIAALLLTTVALISSIPWLFPPRQTMPEEIDAATALGIELPPFFIGTTTLGEFLPIQVAETPPPFTNDAALRAGDNPDRLRPIEGAVWTRLDENPINAQYQIETRQPQQLTYEQFYFPGWEVLVDGAPVKITPSTPHGLITFELPAGTHDLQIQFQNSWARTVGWLISGMTFLVLLVLAFIALRQPRQTVLSLSDTQLVKGSDMVLWGGIAVIIWLFFAYVDTPLRRATLHPDGIYGKPTIETVDFAGEVKLLSYERPDTAVSADTLIPLTLYLQAQRDIGVPYSIGLQILDANGVNWMANNLRPTNWRFIADEPWPLDAYRMEPYLLKLLDGTPPGTYQILVGLVRSDTGQTVAAHNIDTIQVGQPMQGEFSLEDGMSAAPETAVAHDLQLLGTRLDRQETRPGDPLRVTSLWQVQGEPPDNQFTLQLLTPDGDIALAEPITIAPEYPVAQWQEGDRLRSETLLRLPASLANGIHQWQIMWGEQIVDVGEIAVDAPERTFEIPDVETAVNETFGNTATLLGINTTTHADNTNAVEVTLFWQAEEETPISYRVFVHLIDPDGNILNQSDSEPAQWRRPTTSWLTGEVITDQHQLLLPDDLPSDTQLRIGLYDPITNQRLTTETAEFVIIPLLDNNE